MMNLNILPSRTPNAQAIPKSNEPWSQKRLSMDWLRKLLGHSVWEGDDRRQALRASCYFEVQISNAKMSFWGKARDIGAVAVRVEAVGPLPASLKPGAVVQVKHLCPAFGVPRDTIDCKVLWVKRKNQNSFHLAVAFHDRAENLRRSWVPGTVMGALKRAPSQKRRHVRVRLDWLVPALYRNEIIKVRLRDLSMGGALVESTYYLAEGESIALKVKDLKLTCDVCRIEKKGGTYMVGLRFTPEFKQARQLLELIKFIAANG